MVASVDSGSAVLGALPLEVPCPQCGALSQPPHQVDTFVCPWCGSTLHPDGGVRVYRLAQRPRVTPAAAEQAVRAWFAGPDLPRGMEREARVEVGALTSFPFLRARSPESESVSALAALPLAEVAELERVPADLVPAAEGALAELCRIAVDEEVLKAEVRRAMIDPGVRELFLEERVFYPVRYAYQSLRFSAVVEAGSGRVLAGRRPARRDIVGEWGLALGTGVVLFGEALLLPGLPLKIGAVALSGAGLYPLLRWVVATHG
jgi:hypothetical protein